MSEPNRSLDRITIPNPCDANWDEMIGNDQVRFCEHCSLHVTNLSSMTRQEAMHFVSESRGRICVRYLERPNGGVLIQKMPEKLYRIGRRVSRLAAGAFTATLSLSNAMGQSQSNTNHTAERVQSIETNQDLKTVMDEFTASVSGTIKTSEGAPIANATVVLVEQESGEERYTTSSSSGDYSFQVLAEGNYFLWIRKPRFRTEREAVRITANTPVRQDFEMQARMLTMMGGAMGAFVVPQEPLLRAINVGDVETVRTLVSAPLKFGRIARATSYLSDAVQLGNRQIVQVLLEAGADPNFRIDGKDPALLALSEKSSPELVHDLILAGAKLNARDSYGYNALMTAAGSSSIAVLRELIEAGSPVTATNSAGETALFAAARSNSSEALLLLLDAGTNINTQNENGETALMVAAYEGTLDKFKALLARGADANLVNDDGKTLLLLASENEDAGIAKLIIELGTNVNAQDSDGQTALMIAASTERVEIIRLLAGAGANLNMTDAEGQTALMKAAMRGSVDAVNVVLSLGADLTIRDKGGKTALALARESNEDDVVAILKSRGAPE